MKLVARIPIYNNKAVGVAVDEKHALFQHQGIVPKGARFEIGKAEFFKDLSASEQEVVGTLVFQTKSAVFDNKENVESGVIPTIDKEVAAELGAAKKPAVKV